MSLSNLQNKLGVTDEKGFGPKTLKAAMVFYKLTPFRAAHFFAQCGHETGDFKKYVENLNYSAEGLQGVFGKYFPTKELALQYERQPEKIANRVYANRMGNGPEESGDGYKYRGRGAIQLTGKDNYQAFAKYVNRPEIMTNPDIVAEQFAFESAMYFFEKTKIWALCDQGITDAAILAVTKKVNGGDHGLADRSEKTKKYSGWLNQ